MSWVYYFIVQKLKTIQECTGELWDIYSKEVYTYWMYLFEMNMKKF